METAKRVGLFHAIDSFLIRRRGEFYLIGTLEEGEVKENWFAYIKLNKTLSLTVRIKQIEDVEFSNAGGTYKLLVVHEPEGHLLGLNVGNEPIDIFIEGED